MSGSLADLYKPSERPYIPINPGELLAYLYRWKYKVLPAINAYGGPELIWKEKSIKLRQEDVKETLRVFSLALYAPETQIFCWNYHLFGKTFYGGQLEFRDFVWKEDSFLSPQIWMIDFMVGFVEPQWANSEGDIVKEVTNEKESTDRFLSFILIIPTDKGILLCFVSDLYPEYQSLYLMQQEQNKIAHQEYVDNLRPKIYCEFREYGRESGIGMLSGIACSKSFMESTLSEQQVFRPSRAERRRAKKEKRKDLSSLKIIRLRRVDRQQKKRPGQESSQVDWSCQWIVRGHNREQWFPSEGKHKSIWINPYVKGPEDKPLREPGDRLFSVDR